jgi:hypothetical protein
MAHYALLDSNNVVTEVIVGIDENELIEGLSPEVWYGNFCGQVCKRTSYNASSNGFRKQYAGIGYSYDADLDIFIAPAPFGSWILDENHDWQPPTPMPVNDKKYAWFEPNKQWIELV